MPRYTHLLFALVILCLQLPQAHAADKAPVLKIPILVYHHIRATSPYPKSTWSYKMSVSPQVFDAHMQWLHDHQYTSITLDTLVDRLQNKVALPEKPVVITFDDNNLAQYELAVPVLEKHQLIGTFYIVSNRLDHKTFLSRDQIRDMVVRGMDIQSHSVTHSTLSNLPLKKLQWELAESKRALEELTGKPVRHIAYPSVGHNAQVRAQAKLAGYVTGAIMDPRAATPASDLFKLPRIMMTDDTKLASVLP